MTYPHQKTATQPFSEETYHEKLEVSGDDLRRAIDQRIEKLIISMNTLRNSLNREIKHLVDEGVDYSINSLGVVQSHGTEIDLLCGELAALKDVLRSSGAWQESWRK